MKKTSKRIFTVIMCAMLTSASLASCTVGEENEKIPSTQGTQGQPPIQTEVSGESQNVEKPSSNSNNTSNDSHDIQTDTYKEQISYYMSLTESLQADLIKLKEENYIDVCEYQMQIKTLEQTIQDLKDTIVSMTESINPPSIDGIQTPPSNDNLSVKTEYKYTTSNGEVTITEYTGSSLDVAIPSFINGNPVTCIGEEAFKGKQIRSVVIPSGVKKIDWFAFSGCTVLELITIPSSVISVQYAAFDLCPKSLVIKCNKGSYIEAYAKSWGMNVTAE